MLNRSLFSIILGIAVLGLFGFSQSAFAAPFPLDNGPGDGTLMVGVDGFGAFGLAIGTDSTNAFYDPVGAAGPTDTTFESGIAIRTIDLTTGARSFLTSGTIGSSGGLTNPTVSGTSTSGSSTFSDSGLSFTLVQTLAPTFTGSSQTGTILTQTYTITSSVPFEIVRYIDGDLRFDGSLVDGGGRLILGDGTEVLFETDSATGSSTGTTFVGITGEGGTEPTSNRYEIDSFSGLRNRIISGTALDDTITGDGADGDQFIDAGAGYDVTLAFRNEFPSGTSVYVTKTIFGSGAPEDIQTSSPIGGIIIPIDATSLLIAGFDKNSFSLLGALTLVGAAAFGALYYTSKRKNYF